MHRAAGVGAASEDVSATGAANTLFRERRRWRAENTDVDGLFDPLSDHDTGEGRTALVLGTGGAARAAIVATRRLGYEVAVTGRRDEAADAIASQFGVDSLAWADVPASEADLYVNATPVGWRPDDPSAVAATEQRPRPFARPAQRAAASSPASRCSRCRPPPRRGSSERRA